jgi:REP element-mobilizing transposase RayT
MSTGIYDNTGYHNRRSIRLRGYDYSQTGIYFITLCIHDRAQFVFGNIVGATGVSPQMELNEYGAIANEWIAIIPNRYQHVTVDSYIIMPDHVHMIVTVGANVVGAIHVGAIHVGAIHELPLQSLSPIPKRNGDDFETIRKQRRIMTIPKIVGFYRMNVSKRINELCKVPGKTVWQRNYFDHIIRNERSLFRIRQYIRNNPKNWVADAQNHLKNEFGEIDENGNS